VDATADLRVLLASEHPLLLATVDEEQRFLAMLRRVAADASIPLWIWTASRGLARDGKDAQYDTTDPRRALAFVGDLPGPGVFVFADAHPMLAQPVTLRTVKDVALGLSRGQTLVLTGPHHDPPPELRGLALPWRLCPPGDDEIGRLVRRTVDDLTLRGLAGEFPAPEQRRLVAALRGLTLADAERLLQRAVLRDGRLDAADVAWVRSAKAEILNTDGVLELIESETGTLERIGGLDGLKRWLRTRARAVRDPDAARAAGVEAPRGILLTGVPGCGKSLVAKTLAAAWDRPLVLLDPARVYRKYVGVSEQRLDSALATAERMRPIVLWIDEIEKGFAAGGDGDGGVSSRLLGTFLRWMQDRPDGVFVVATANDVSRLPAEFLRKGRFDEVFFVDLPDAAARRSIFTLHLEVRGLDPGGFDLEHLVAVTDGFSGAEIEAAIVGGAYRAFAADLPPTTGDVAAEAAGTVPLSEARPEDVARLRAWAEARAVTA
jgi:AAA+ superfamily predicted ATPase